jgi:hypothetical protein
MKTLKAILIAIYPILIILLLLTQPKPEPEEEYEATIRVIDADTRQPLDSVKVRITTTDEDTPRATLTTDESGECTFDYTDPEGTLLTAVATRDGYKRGERNDIDFEYFEDSVLIIPLKKQDIINEGIQSGGNGKLKITLMWNDPTVDLDLHVLEPNGFELYFNDSIDHRTDGHLDLDWRPSRDDPNHIVENIYWGGLPPRGQYKVWVRFYGPPDAQPTTCNVIIYREGRSPEVFNLETNEPENNYPVSEFVYP